MSYGAMDRMEMVNVCLKCYEQWKRTHVTDQGSVERLRKHHCHNVQHQWSRQSYDSVMTVIDGSGIAYMVTCRGVGR